MFLSTIADDVGSLGDELTSGEAHLLHVTLELVRQESELDRDDLEDDDPDAPEKIVGSPKFDVGELIEDELILEVPYVPKHELCANGAPADDSGLVDQPEEAQRPSPFAVLGQLKAKGK